jgi:hypothetical protein
VLGLGLGLGYGVWVNIQKVIGVRVSVREWGRG